MNTKPIKMFVALATDSRALADFQDDPNAMMARFGLGEHDINEFIESLRQSRALHGGVAIPVTH